MSVNKTTNDHFTNYHNSFERTHIVCNTIAYQNLYQNIKRDNLEHRKRFVACLKNFETSFENFFRSQDNFKSYEIS